MTWELAVKATIILAAAFAATALLTRRSAAMRHLVWISSFGLLLALPAVVAVLPSWNPAPIQFVLGTAVGGSRTASSTAIAGTWLNVWFAGMLIFLMRLALSHLMLWRNLPASRGNRRLQHPSIAAPMTWGIFRPVILLPVDDTPESVLRHEQAHVERRDGLWLLAAQLTCAIYWFHPLAWLAARKAAEERERACDDRVLRSGAAAVNYADALLACARRTVAAPAAALPATHALERRVRAILDANIERSLPSRRWTAAILAGALLVALPIAALRAQDVHKVADCDTPPRLLFKVEPDYTQEARDAKISGTVTLSIVVGRDGSARDIVVIEGLDSGLDGKAIEAVKKWRFEPGKIKDKPVDVQARIEINFRLV
jgi:TonB family protein